MAEQEFVVYTARAGAWPESHALLLRCAADYTGLSAAVFRREQSPGEKPRLVGGPPLHFSVSHSGGRWVCAFGPRPLGLDLQQHRPCRVEALARRFFHPQEVEWLARCGFAPEEFFRLWAAKESFVKLSGRGFGSGFADFCLAPLPPAPRWQFLPFGAGFTLCLCAEALSPVTFKPIQNTTTEEPLP